MYLDAGFLFFVVPMDDGVSDDLSDGDHRELISLFCVGTFGRCRLAKPGRLRHEVP